MREIPEKEDRITMLEEKLDLLTKEVVALRKAIESSGGAAPAKGKAAAAASDDADEKPKRGRPRAKPVEPDHDKDEVETIIRKVSKDVGRPAAKAIIADQGADDLADLLTKPEVFDAAYAAAEKALEGDEPAEEEEDI